MNTDDALNDEDLNLLDSLFAPFNADIQHKYKISISHIFLDIVKNPHLLSQDLILDFYLGKIYFSLDV